MNKQEENINEPQNPAFLVGAVIGSACLRHKPKQLGYLQWHDWAEQKTKRGAKQKQCPKCGRWYFREEF